MEYLKELRIEYVPSKRKNPVRGQVTNPKQIWEAFRDIENADREKIFGVYLNAQHVINTFELLSLGNTEFTTLKPMDIFKGAILTSSSHYILVHNHPSGAITPSEEDKLFMTKLWRLSDELGLGFSDFIIIGNNSFWSMSESGSKPKHKLVLP